jgi:YVTN family beta-propeller protein
VSVIDTDALTVRKTIPVGKIPWGVALGEAP